MGPSVSQVCLGSKVKIAFHDGTTRVFEILDGGMGIPDTGLLNAGSSLGQAILGRSIGSTVRYSVGGKWFEVTILELLE